MKQQHSVGSVFLQELTDLYEIDILSVLLQARVTRDKKIFLTLMQELEGIPETWDHEDGTYTIEIEVKKKS